MVSLLGGPDVSFYNGVATISSVTIGSIYKKSHGDTPAALAVTLASVMTAATTSGLSGSRITFNKTAFVCDVVVSAYLGDIAIILGPAGVGALDGSSKVSGDCPVEEGYLCDSMSSPVVG